MKHSEKLHTLFVSNICKPSSRKRDVFLALRLSLPLQSVIK